MTRCLAVSLFLLSRCLAPGRLRGSAAFSAGKPRRGGVGCRLGQGRATSYSPVFPPDSSRRSRTSTGRGRMRRRTTSGPASPRPRSSTPPGRRRSTGRSRLSPATTMVTASRTSSGTATEPWAPPRSALRAGLLRVADLDDERARAASHGFGLGAAPGFTRIGRLGKCRSPIQASAAMCVATSSTGGLRVSVHHWPTKVTIPISACA